MQPLEITFELGSPVILAGPPGEHLDGLMAYSQVHDREQPLSNLKEIIAASQDLPLERYVAQDGRWVWKASNILYEQTNNTSAMCMTRRMDANLMAQKRMGEDFGRRSREAAYKKAMRAYRQDKSGKTPKPEDLPEVHVPDLVMRGKYLNTGSGQQRTFLMMRQTIVSPRAKAYCIGDEQAVRTIVERITSLGKKRAIGSGLVNKVTVAVVPSEECLWYVRNMPEVPSEQAQNFELYGSGGLVSPYWDKTRHVSVYRHKAYP